MQYIIVRGREIKVTTQAQKAAAQRLLHAERINSAKVMARVEGRPDFETGADICARTLDEQRLDGTDWC